MDVMMKSLFTIVIFCLSVNMVHAEVYKWIDENGKTVYGDKPTSDDANLVEIKTNTKQDKNFQERNEKQKKLLNVLKEERDEKRRLKGEERERKEKQEAQCTKIKKELQEIKDASLLYDDTDDPNNPRIYSDDERKAEENKYSNYIKEHC